MPRLKSTNKTSLQPSQGGLEKMEGLAKAELALVAKNRGNSIRQKQANFAGIRKDVFIPEDINLIIESLPTTEWNRVRGILGRDSINLHELRRIFDAQAIALGWKTSGDHDVQFSLNTLRTWVREQQIGDIAKQVQKDLAPYRGLPTRAVLEKIVYDCYAQAEKIRAWLFDSGAANISDADLMRAYPRMQDAAIKGIEALHKLNEHKVKREARMEGAKEMAFAIYEVVKGTKLEEVVKRVITDVVIDIEAEEDISPNS